MNLDTYKKLVNEFPSGNSRYLNLSSNFQIGLGIEHKNFCDSMISSGMFRYQDYAPEYNLQDSYLLWHKGVLELRVWWEFYDHLKRFSKEVQDKFKITVQTNQSDDKPSLTLPKDERVRIMKDVILYLIHFAEEKKIPFGISNIYYNHPSGPESLLWLPDL